MNVPMSAWELRALALIGYATLLDVSGRRVMAWVMAVVAGLCVLLWAYDEGGRRGAFRLAVSTGLLLGVVLWMGW